MSLLTSLRLAITALQRAIAAPQPGGDGFDVLLTQDEHALITQNNIFIVRQTVYVDLLSADGFAISTQDGRILQAGV